MKKRIFDLFYVLFLLAGDQFTKYLADRHLKLQAPKRLIPNILSLVYVENRGSAFGLFQGMSAIFLVISLVLFVMLIIGYFRIPQEKGYTIYRILFLTLLAGGIGNAIDRFFRGYVIDFLNFDFIQFPVFNIADCYVTISLAVFIIYTLVSKTDIFALLWPETDSKS